jgi:transcriptional regulator with XRE-family HTH domain
MSHAGKNLKYLRKLRGWTQEEFANKLKIKRSLLGAYEEERAEPRIEVLETVGHMFKISLDELLLKDLNVVKGGTYLEKRRQMKLVGAVAEVQYVPVKAAAGYLVGYADPEFVDELNTFTLPMLAAGSYRAFEISGDSMLPTESGSVVVGQKVEDMDTVKSNNPYIVVSRSEGIVYKRVTKNNRSKNKVTLVSDNPRYQPYQINTEDIVELWHAEWVIAKPNLQNNPTQNFAAIVNDLQEQISSLKKKLP